MGADVVVQEDFTQQGFILLQKLEEYITGSDKLIALVGRAYGCAPEPAALQAEAPGAYIHYTTNPVTQGCPKNAQDEKTLLLQGCDLCASGSKLDAVLKP